MGEERIQNDQSTCSEPEITRATPRSPKDARARSEHRRGRRRAKSAHVRLLRKRGTLMKAYGFTASTTW